MRRQWILTFNAMALIVSVLSVATASAQAPYQSVLRGRKPLDAPLYRLPPTEPTLALLPPVTPGSLQDRDSDVVLFAAEAVEITPPPGWHVRDVAMGREMRLLISPTQQVIASSLPADALWITYHAIPHAAPPSANEVATFLSMRTSTLTSNGASLSSIQSLSVQSWPAARQEFALPGSINNPHGSRGFHEVVGTQWGFCEIHAESSASVHSQRAAAFEQMMQTLVLAEPHDHHVPTSPETQAAAGALGSWKAYRSRMKLFGDGRVLIIQDAALHQPLDQPRGDRDPAHHRIAGHFQAREDLLLVTWADGSRQNYRWRRQGNSLLLTDHQGQTNHLKKIYE